MNFYISDTHFGHGNVIMYDDRPYKDAAEMDEDMIKRWNSVVTDSDTVYILGDFCWSTKGQTIADILGKLNGSKVLIKGNHDITKAVMSVQNVTATSKERFSGVHDYLEIKDNGTKLVMCHYPIQLWKSISHGVVHLYGHVHVSDEWNMTRKWHLEVEDKYGRELPMINVGCSCWYMDYTPRTLPELLSFYKDDMARFKQSQGEKKCR